MYSTNSGALEVLLGNEFSFDSLGKIRVFVIRNVERTSNKNIILKQKTIIKNYFIK